MKDKNLLQNSTPAFNVSGFLRRFKTGIWSIGSASWLFGMIDRNFAALADGCLSAIDVLQVLIATFFFLAWLILKPNWLKRNLRG